MSLIEYQRATYAIQLRERLELAGCDVRVAAVLSHAVAELLDHVEQARDDVRRDIDGRDCRAVFHAADLRNARRDRFDRVIGVMLVVMAVAVVCAIVAVSLAALLEPTTMR